LGTQGKRNGINRDIIVIGTSSGGVEAILTLMSALPRDLPAAILIVLHVPATGPSLMPQLIATRTGWPALHPRDGDEIKNGVVYMAPPDYHVTVSGDSRVHVTRGPKENRHRPAVDPLFRSAAVAFGPRVIGVILTGALDDGTAGLQAVKSCGGTTVVQHPEDALVRGMPENALHYVEVDHCVPLAKLGALLSELVTHSRGPDVSTDCEMIKLESPPKDASVTPSAMKKQLGPPSGFICPECNGPLWEVREGRHSQFRCLVGHQFSPESLLAEEGEALERALWVAIKTLQERATLLNNLAGRSAASGPDFRAKATECEEHGAVIRGIIKMLQV
jgi:two-component system chemotaxis response regulator CheB